MNPTGRDDPNETDTPNTDGYDPSQLFNDDGTVDGDQIRALSASRTAGNAEVTASLCVELRREVAKGRRPVDLKDEYEPVADTIRTHVKGDCSCPVSVPPCEYVGGEWGTVNE